jgi:flagellar protein FliO/FliZ
MFDLFGSELPLAARFFIAFLVVLALIGLTAWLVRRFGANRLGTTVRGRQPWLAVIDAANVDGRRRLVLIRRDNVEHLLMIGGPTDVVIEPNIVRGAAAREPAREAPREIAREAPREPARPAVAAEPQVRPAPSAETAWPLQPTNEPAPTPRAQRAPAPDEPWLPPEPGARPRPADSLTGLAADLSAKLAPPPSGAPPAQRQEPRLAMPQASAEPAATSQTDRNLSEMAQQLEAALRRTPVPGGRPPVTDPFATQPAPPAQVAQAPEAPPPEVRPEPEPTLAAEPEFELQPEPAPRVEPQPVEPQSQPEIVPTAEAKPEPKPEPAAQHEQSLYDNLEEEMASLLGRPSGRS